MVIKSNYNKSILCVLPKLRRLLFLPIIIRISGMEFSFQKTILNVKTGTLGKGVLSSDLWILNGDLRRKHTFTKGDLR